MFVDVCLCLTFVVWLFVVVCCCVLKCVARCLCLSSCVVRLLLFVVIVVC